MPDSNQSEVVSVNCEGFSAPSLYDLIKNCLTLLKTKLFELNCAET